VKTFLNGLWVFFGIGGFLGFFSAPITYYLGPEFMNLSLYVGVGSVAVLAFMAFVRVWVEGARTRPGVLSAVFLGIALAGGISLGFGAASFATVAIAVGVVGMLVTGVLGDVLRPKAVGHH
jgi:hypothetical protein